MFEKGQIWTRNDDFFTVINIHPDHPNEAFIQAKDGRKLWINIYIAKDLGYKLKDGEFMKERVCKCVPFEDTELSDNLEGIVISEEVAKLAPCMRVKGTDLVFTKGVVGALNEKQRSEFCPTIVDVERPAFEARIERWKNAIKTCKERTKHLTGGEKLKQYVNCMSVEARKD